MAIPNKAYNIDFKNSIYTPKVKFDIKTQDVCHKKVYITHSGTLPQDEYQGDERVFSAIAEKILLLIIANIHIVLYFP